MIDGGTVYPGDLAGRLLALNRETGALRWTYETGNAVHCSPLVTDDTIYFGGNVGYVDALDRSKAASTGT